MMALMSEPGCLSAGRQVGYQDLLACALDGRDGRTLAFAGVIAQGLALGQRPLIRGLAESEFQSLLRDYFPGASLENGSGPVDGIDEFDDLLALLKEYRADDGKGCDWLAHAVATAAMRDNHLWQDMGLPNRQVLSQLMRDNFPGLAARNVGDMKWKKFFYRQLCERAGIMICKSPNCQVCSDHELCFGAEDGAALVAAKPFIAKA